MFLISHTRRYLSIRIRHDAWSHFEEHGEAVLSHADAECDEMQSFLQQAMTSAGLHRFHILDKTRAAALIALLSNQHVVPRVCSGVTQLFNFINTIEKVGLTVLVCDGGPSNVEITVYAVSNHAEGKTTLERLRSSGMFYCSPGDFITAECFFFFWVSAAGWSGND